MSKQKTNKSLEKRIKITASKKLLRRHQLSAGHLKRNKSKNALQRQSKSIEVFKAIGKRYKRLLGI